MHATSQNYLTDSIICFTLLNEWYHPYQLHLTVIPQQTIAILTVYITVIIHIHRRKHWYVQASL